MRPRGRVGLPKSNGRLVNKAFLESAGRRLSVRGTRATRAREANLILSCRRRVPGRGDFFGFKFSSRRHPWKFGVKRFLVVREVAGAVSGVACFWLPPWKKFSAACSRSCRSQEQSAVPRCAILSVGSTGGIGQ